MRNYKQAGWYFCKHCGYRIYISIFEYLPCCDNCRDKPYLELERMELHFGYKEIGERDNPTSFEVYAYDKSNDFHHNFNVGITFDNLYVARRFCEVMNREEGGF
jgi:hypothetical protein